MDLTNHNNYNFNNPVGSLNLRKITKNEICNIISNMKNDSAPGIDGISINVIKNGNDLIFTILETILNPILIHSFKIAVVSPLYKGKGLKADLTNYRPIGLVNVFSKIFGKAIKIKFNYLEENNLLPSSQCGFRDLRLRD